MQVHLVDGTYELFRHFFGMPSHVTVDDREVGAVRGSWGRCCSSSSRVRPTSASRPIM